MKKEKYNINLEAVLESVFDLSENLKTANIIKFSDELIKAGAVKKIAFDVYKVTDDPYSNLWMLEDIDGAPHLVRASDPIFNSVDSGDWSAISDYDNENVTLSYKNIPISRFSSIQYGFKSNDINSFKSALLSLAVEDEAFVKDLFVEQPFNKKEALISTFPELNKFIKG